MTIPIVLASGSAIRAQMLRQAGVSFAIKPARVDEDSIKASLLAEGAAPRDVADTLAEMKSRNVARRLPESIVIGSDQVLDFDGALLSKATDPDTLFDQLKAMRGKSHTLYSAAVIYQGGEPVWRHVGKVRMQMRMSSDAYLRGYIARNWEEIRHCVGGYQLENEGIRLFSAIDGDYFCVLGMPLVELLNYLSVRRLIDQ